MSETEVLPEIKQIVGALLFAAKGPLAAAELRRILQQTAEKHGGPYRDFARLKEADLAAAVEALRADLAQARAGLHVGEVAHGYRLQNDANCGPWLRQMLDRGRANRLTKPALETLAVIAYRQPCTRAEIEAVRGVAVDQIVRNLLDLQLIRITGRSEHPGRPWLFGTTQKFLEYFGIKDVKDLPGLAELRRMDEEQQRRVQENAAATAAGLDQEAAVAPVAAEAGAADGAGPADVEKAEAFEDEGEDEEAFEDDDEYEDDDEEDESEDEDEDENEDEDEGEAGGKGGSA